MDDGLARRLDRITVLLEALLAVHVLVLLAATETSSVGLVIVFVIVGMLVALVGGHLTDRSPFRASDRHRGR